MCSRVTVATAAVHAVVCSGAVQEDDEGYLRHVAFGVLNRLAVRSDAVVLAAV